MRPPRGACIHTVHPISSKQLSLRQCTHSSERCWLLYKERDLDCFSWKGSILHFPWLQSPSYDVNLGSIQPLHLFLLCIVFLHCVLILGRDRENRKGRGRDPEHVWLPLTLTFSTSWILSCCQQQDGWISELNFEDSVLGVEYCSLQATSRGPQWLLWCQLWIDITITPSVNQAGLSLHGWLGGEPTPPPPALPCRT